MSCAIATVRLTSDGESFRRCRGRSFRADTPDARCRERSARPSSAPVARSPPTNADKRVARGPVPGAGRHARQIMAIGCCNPSDLPAAVPRVEIAAKAKPRLLRLG
jgi:hypothetical protein